MWLLNANNTWGGSWVLKLSYIILGVTYTCVAQLKPTCPTETAVHNLPSNVINVIPYLQSEMASCSSAQQQIVTFLHGKRIPIGQGVSLRNMAETVRSRIVVSTKEKGVECRIALGKAPPGAKCVAPCGCSGSQKWVQFSELNRLRRKDPTQWTICRTCQQKFDYSMFEPYGGLPGNIVGLLLDNKPMLRAFVVAFGVLLFYVLNAPLWISRVLTSRILWQQVL